MFIREVKNRSGSISIQIIGKATGSYKVIKSLGSAITLQDIEKMKMLGRQEIKKISKLQELFESTNDKIVEQVLIL